MFALNIYCNSTEASCFRLIKKVTNLILKIRLNQEDDVGTEIPVS